SGWGGPPNGLGGLYKTTNRGATWTKLTGSTLDRVTSCTFNPNNANQIFITTETQGLWMSNNINAPTPTFSLVNNYSFRHPERVFFNPFNPGQIWVGSFGNGMAVGTMSNTGEPEFSSENSLSIYPNPTYSNVTLSISASSMHAPLEACNGCKIYNLYGAEVKTLQLQKGENNIDVSELPAGVYFVRAGNVTRKLIIEK
ncbi:MAG TPA: T9SS type A sorting domain-containing protein, partial [Bacteroidia bacterium]